MRAMSYHSIAFIAAPPERCSSSARSSDISMYPKQTRHVPCFCMPVFLTCIKCAMQPSSVVNKNNPWCGLTFQFSISVCLALYCLSKSSNTCFSPSAFVLSAGSTSFTVRSTRTPLTMRKHFRSCGRGSRVSMTSLGRGRRTNISSRSLKKNQRYCEDKVVK